VKRIWGIRIKVSGRQMERKNPYDLGKVPILHVLFSVSLEI
jgi:hypothetical protein